MLRLHQAPISRRYRLLFNAKTRLIALSSVLASAGIFSSVLALRSNSLALANAGQGALDVSSLEVPSVDMPDVHIEAPAASATVAGSGSNASASASVNGKTYSVNGNGSIHKTEKNGNNTTTVDITLDSTGDTTNSMTVTNNGVTTNSFSSSSSMVITSNSEGTIIQQ